MININGKNYDINISDVIDKIKLSTKYFPYVKSDGDDLLVSCPFHKGGQERHPSMGIALKNIKQNNRIISAGTCHCFTCGYKTISFPKFIGDLFGQNEDYGIKWLQEHYNLTIDNSLNLEPITLSTNKKEILDENILVNYRYYHPYMYKRKLTNEVIQKFDVGYNPATNCITFPVRDIKGNLIGISERNVENKLFNLPKLVDKPVYLLYNVLNEGYDIAFICESQINALTLWTYGYPGVALFGTGSQYQYNILKKCGIKHFVLCFDGDEAGYKGSQKFIKAMPDDCFIEVVNLPLNTDINDLSKEQFEQLYAKRNKNLISI